MKIDKTVNQKEYDFQGLKLKLLERNMEVRKNALLFLDELMEYSKVFANEQLAQFAFFSDENKCKEFFKLTIEGELDKINYDVNNDDNFLMLQGFISQVIKDFFSFIFRKPKKTTEESEN